MPLVTLPGFDERVRRHTWTGSRALVHYQGHRACTRCSIGEVIQLGPFIQPALFFHGGYGAAERRVVDVCLACGRVTVAQFDTVNPRELARTVIA